MLDLKVSECWVSVWEGSEDSLKKDGVMKMGFVYDWIVRKFVRVQYKVENLNQNNSDFAMN